MKTNAVPAVIMLTAGFIDCILSLYEHVSLYQFTKRLFLVLLIFYILGCVVKIILDMNIKDESEESEEDEQENEDAPEEGVVENSGQDTENDSAEEMEDSENTDPDREDTE